MKVIPWEDKQLTPRQREILYGSLLGDGRLECRSKNETVRFRVHHADSQKDLLLWKYNEFKEFVVREPWCTEWYDQRYKKKYKSWFFHTKTLQIFTPIYRQFYKNGQKHIPNNIVNHFTPLVIAVWIVDDGCKTSDGLILNTQSFSLNEQNKLLAVLDYRYKIQGTINRDRQNFRLRFNRINTNQLRVLVYPFKIPILKTKFVPVTTDSILLDR